MPTRPTLRPFRTPPTTYSPTQGGFRAVDLDIAAPTDLTPLLQVLEPKLLVLHSRISPRRSFIMAELNTQLRSASTSILRFVKVLEALTGKPRTLWKQCTCRCFNIGYNGPSSFPALCDIVSLEALRAAISVEAEIGITMYRPDGEQFSSPSGVRKSGLKAPAASKRR